MRGWSAERRFGAALALILAVALVARLGVAWYADDATLRTDTLDYDRTAVSLAADGSFPASRFNSSEPTAFRPPLYPLVLAAVYRATGTTHEAARLDAARGAQAVLGTLVVALVALVAGMVWGRVVALVAAALAAVYPPLWLVGSTLLSEPLFLACMLGAVAAVLGYRRDPRARWVVLTGALVGLACLTRSNGWLLALPLAAGVWTARPRATGAWRSAAAPALLVACAAAVVLPWTVRNAGELNAFVPVTTQVGYALAGKYNALSESGDPRPAAWRAPEDVPAFRSLLLRPDLDEVELDRGLRSRSLRYARDHPGYVLEAAWYDTRRTFNLDGQGVELAAAHYVGQPPGLTKVAFWAFFAFGLLALLGALRPQARRAPFFLWLVPGIMLVPAVFVDGISRYRAPADVFIVMLAALALVALRPRSL